MRDPQRLMRLLSLLALVFSVVVFVVYFAVQVKLGRYVEQEARNGRPQDYAMLVAARHYDAEDQDVVLPKL